MENLRDQDIDAAVAGREQVNELYRAIGQLGEVDKLLIMMVLDELEYDQIASVMGISEATLRVKIHRIKQRIKNFMSHAG
ncbi:MAG: sigma-70 family RNA polymerase sigma factor [Flavipsychrobacter sp.]|nr:sigma-70 family RNA polymerase sigma factor [Flavipsychrobacter sp.]